MNKFCCFGLVNTQLFHDHFHLIQMPQIRFYSSVRLDIRRIGSIKKADKVLGNRTRVKVVKNKVAPPFRQVEFDIIYGKGISQVGELIDLSLKLGLVKRSGAWYSCGDTRIGQGRDNACQYMLENTELYADLLRKIRVHYELETPTDEN